MEGRGVYTALLFEYVAGCMGVWGYGGVGGF